MICPITLSGRAVWINNWLNDYIDVEAGDDIFVMAMRIYLYMLRASHKRKTLLYQQRGRKLSPVPLLNPMSQIKLPDEAYKQKKELFLFTFAKRSILGLKQLQKLTGIQDIVSVIENALCLVYDLVSRTSQSQIFFLRDGNTSRLERIEICSFM